MPETAREIYQALANAAKIAFVAVIDVLPYLTVVKFALVAIVFSQHFATRLIAAALCDWLLGFVWS